MPSTDGVFNHCKIAGHYKKVCRSNKKTGETASKSRVPLMQSTNAKYIFVVRMQTMLFSLVMYPS